MSVQIVNSFVISEQEVKRLTVLKEQVSNSFKFDKLTDDACLVILDPNEAEKRTETNKNNFKQTKSQKLPYKHACVTLFGQVIPAFHYSKESKNLSSLSDNEYQELINSKERDVSLETPTKEISTESSKEPTSKTTKPKIPSMNYLKGNYVLNEDLIKAFNLDPVVFESERKKLSLSTVVYKDRIGKGVVRVIKKDVGNVQNIQGIQNIGNIQDGSTSYTKYVDKIFKHVKSTAQFTHVNIAWKIVFNMRKDIAESVMLMTYQNKPTLITVNLKMIQHKEASSNTLDYTIYGVEKSIKKAGKGETTYKLVKYADEDKLKSVSVDKLCYTFRLRNPEDKKMKITQVAIKKVFGIEDAKAKIDEMSKYIPKTFDELTTKLGLKAVNVTNGNQIYEASKIMEFLIKQNAEKEAKKNDPNRVTRTRTSDFKPLNKPPQKTVQLSDIGDASDIGDIENVGNIREGIVNIPDGITDTNYVDDEDEYDYDYDYVDADEDGYEEYVQEDEEI